MIFVSYGTLDVSDESAQAIGKLLGAQVIVSGIISQLGSTYRLRVRAISVETAEIQGQFNRDIISSSRLIALISNCNATQSQPTYPAGNHAVPDQEDSSVQTNPPSSSPPLPVSTTTLPYETFIVKRELDVTNTGSFAISPDGKYAIVETNTGQRLCDAETGQEIRVIRGHNGAVGYALFSPNGQTIVSRDNKSIYFWNITNGELLRTISSPNNADFTSSLVYSPDGTKIAAVTGSGGYSSLALSSDGTTLIINTVGRRTYVLGME